MRAIIAITLFAALAIAGCASNDDGGDADPAGNSTTNTTTPTPTPSPTPEDCSGVEPPVGPCIEPPAPSRQ